MAGLLTGFEYYLSTGAPVVGAAVDYWPAVVGTPGGASAGSTTTDGNGRWTFSPAAAGQYDVRVVLGARTRWYKGLSATSLQELYVNGALRLGAAASLVLAAGATLDISAGGLLVGFPFTKLGEATVVGGGTCGLTGLSVAAYDYFLAIFQGSHNGIALGGAIVGKLFLRLNALSDAHYDSQKTTFQQATSTQTESLNANEWDVGMIPGNTNLGRAGVCAVLFGADFFQSWFSWNTQSNPTTGQVRHGIAGGSRDASLGGALTQVHFAIESAAVFNSGQINLYGLG